MIMFLPVSGPLNVLIIGLILACYSLRHHREDPKYLNSLMESNFNITLASKQPIRAGLARARGLKSDMFQHNSRRSKTMMKLLISILLMCGDIQLKPGHQYMYPCGICAKPVRINQQVIQCDFCDIWHHIRCMNMDRIAHEALENSSCVACQVASKCGMPNYSSSPLNSYSDIKHSNRFSPLNTDNFPGAQFFSTPQRQRTQGKLHVYGSPGTQVVQAPTRHNNILDLVFTTHPDLIEGIYVVPSMSDHSAVICDINFKTKRPLNSTRSVYLRKRADMGGLEEQLRNSYTLFQASHPSTKSFEENWT